MIYIKIPCAIKGGREMYKNLVFSKPPVCDTEIKKMFGLTDVLENDRTTILENNDMLLSIDESVIRVMLFDDSDKALLKKIKKYFYGEKK